MMDYPENVESRIRQNAAVAANGCLEYRNIRNGYGSIQIGKKRFLVHRVMFELHSGPIPDGLYICHRCDNKKCCEPTHLYAGTQKENMQEAAAHGLLSKKRGPVRPFKRDGKPLTNAQIVLIIIDKCEEFKGCLLWRGDVRDNGYGVIGINGKNLASHRAMWAAYNEEVIPDGMVIMHDCDVRLCCNPDHLSLGTPQQNARDAADRGLYVSGEAHHNAKLAEGDIEEILTDWEGCNARFVAKQYGVNKSTVQRVRSGNTWQMESKKSPQTKGQRNEKGEFRGHRKLTAEQVAAIRIARDAGEKLKPLAEKYGVCVSNIAEVCRGRTWQHQDQEVPIKDHRNHKLTEAKARTIISLVQAGHPRRAVAEEYGISVSYISNLLNGQKKIPFLQESPT